VSANGRQTFEVWYSLGAHVEVEACDSADAIERARSIWPEGDTFGRIARANLKQPPRAAKACYPFLEDVIDRRRS